MLIVFTFWGIDNCKVQVRLKLGVFSDANVLENWPGVKLNVRVRLNLGVLQYMYILDWLIVFGGKT